MSHLVETMVYAGEVPWHGIGTAIPQNVSAREALPIAGLDWLVEARECYHQVEAGKFEPVPRFRTTVRSSDNRALGVVSDGYGVIQNAELAALADAIAGEGKMWCHTAGSLDEGRRVWFLMQIPGQIRIGADASPIEQYFLLNTRHDGTAACRLQFTPVRVVCNNTLTFALDAPGSSSKGFSLRHSANVADHLVTAREAMASAVAYFESFREVGEALSRAVYSEEQVKALAEFMFPGREDGTAAAITLSYREGIRSLFDGGLGHESIRGTAWAAVNAVAQFVDHGRNHRATPGSSAEENRAKAIWFGSGVDLKKLALVRICTDVGISLSAEDKDAVEPGE